MNKSSSASKPYILLLEDETIIGFELQDQLEEHGYRVFGPLTSCREAISILSSMKPDLALIDFDLKDGSCIELVKKLRECSVPFAVYSGHNHTKAPEDMKNIPWIVKPAPFREIREALEMLGAVA